MGRDGVGIGALNLGQCRGRVGLGIRVYIGLRTGKAIALGSVLGLGKEG